MLYFRRFVTNAFPMYVGKTNKRLPDYSYPEMRKAADKAIERGDRYFYGTWIDQYSDFETFVEQSPNVTYEINGAIPENKIEEFLEFCNKAGIEIEED